MPEMTDMRELLKHELGDILYAERQFLKGLKQQAKEIRDPEMRSRVEAHAGETEVQITRLQDAFAALGEKAKAEECPAAMGLMEEHRSFKSEEKPSRTMLEAFDLGSGLRVEHYEIAAYRTAVSMATALGERECASILKENLREEMAMARFLEKSAVKSMRRLAKETDM